MAPASTDEIAPKRIEYWAPASKPVPPPRLTVRGITRGRRIAIAPHEVPVANEIAAAVRNTRAGISSSGSLSLRICD